MSPIGSIDGTRAGKALPGDSTRAPAATNAELTMLKKQLSSWVNCPSGKTLSGQAHIAEINRQIDAVKAQIKQAAERNPPPGAAQSPEGINESASKLRLDGLGTYLDAQV